MTSLTIELAPELYERLRIEAQRQGKAEQDLAQQLVARQLLRTTQEETPLVFSMLPQIRALIADKPLDMLEVAGKDTPQGLAALFRSWAEEDLAEPDEGDESWEDILRAIDANRHSYRKLFPELEQPE